MLTHSLLRTLMGIVQGFSGLIAARWFLGICESGTYSDSASLDPRSTVTITISSSDIGSV